MTILFVILIILCSLILGLIVLVQNPKGGGLTGSIAGFSNQFMGVKQTTDVLEKGTWIFAAIIGVLCITSAFFIRGGKAEENRLEDIGTSLPATVPQKTAPATNTGVFPGGQTNQPATAPDTNKK